MCSSVCEAVRVRGSRTSFTLRLNVYVMEHWLCVTPFCCFQIYFCERHTVLYVAHIWGLSGGTTYSRSNCADKVKNILFFSVWTNYSKSLALSTILKLHVHNIMKFFQELLKENSNPWLKGNRKGIIVKGKEFYIRLLYID